MKQFASPVDERDPSYELTFAVGFNTFAKVDFEYTVTLPFEFEAVTAMSTYFPANEAWGLNEVPSPATALQPIGLFTPTDFTCAVHEYQVNVRNGVGFPLQAPGVPLVYSPTVIVFGTEGAEIIFGADKEAAELGMDDKVRPVTLRIIANAKRSSFILPPKMTSL